MKPAGNGFRIFMLGRTYIFLLCKHWMPLSLFAGINSLSYKSVCYLLGNRNCKALWFSLSPDICEHSIFG